MVRKDTVYECMDCNKQEIVKSCDHKIDGRVCKHCGGHMSPKGYAFIGIDMATKGKDTTCYSNGIERVYK